VLAMRLDEITADDDVQPRAGGLNAAHVADLAGWLRAHPGRDLPAGRVFRDPATGEHRLTRGFHRRAAYGAADRTHMPVEVVDGDKAAAVLDAAENQDNSLKRTNEDKRRAVRLVLAAAADWSDNQIADHIGVSQNFVSEVRVAVAAESSGLTSDVNPEGSEGSGLVTATNPEGSEPEKKNKGNRARRTKVDHAKAAAKLLLADHTRTDDDVAKELKCKPKVVGIARKALVAKGRIPEPPRAQKSNPGSATKTAEPQREQADTPKQADTDPGLEFVKEVERLCRDMDQIAARAKSLKASPYSHTVHIDSAVSQVEAARKTLWQGRPSEPCPYCRAAGEPQPGCKACRGLNRVKKTTYDAGVAAVGDAA